jgi:hypothetical protein
MTSVLLMRMSRGLNPDFSPQFSTPYKTWIQAFHSVSKF